MNQLFKVGELVVIKSKNRPDLNGGPYSVIEVDYDDYVDFKTGVISLGVYAYKLNDGHIRAWNGKALRKHIPPSTQSFHEIMEGLKRPVVT